MHYVFRGPALVAAGFAALTSAQNAPQPVQSAGGFTYSVCAVEPFDNGLSNTRALHGGSTVSLSNMTVEQCATFCAPFTYFGVEYGSECYCGDRINQATTVDSTGGCNFPCAGAAGEQCGGSGRMNLYTANGMASPNLPATFTPNATASTALSNWNYVNCVVEPFYRSDIKTTARALNASSTETSQMTVEYCANFCSGYSYFGVEYTDQCYCGNTIDSRAELEACGQCTSLCAGDVTETCGGPGHLSFYKASNANQPVFASPSACNAPSATATGSGTATGGAAAPTTTGLNCPTANGTTYTSNGQVFQIECGIDRQGGGTIYAQQENSLGACADLCAAYPGCIDMSWVSGNCYLKNVINSISYNPAVGGARLISGAVSPATVYATAANGGQGQAYNYLGIVNEPAAKKSGAIVAALTLSNTTSSAMNLEACATYCTGFQATFFGVENSNQCYCGNTFSTGSTEAIGVPANPWVTCAGNITEQCGGVSELTAYALPGTPNPFDSNGNLIGSAGATSTAPMSSACNTNSATVCGPSATCSSLGASSSTCGPATITAPMSSACNTNSNTVCASTATCTPIGNGASTCSSLTGGALTSALAASATASAASACNTNSGTVCGPTASCMSLGASSSSCSLSPVSTAAQSSACQTNAGIVCGPKASCASLGPSSSTCQATAAAVATTTASIASACNTNSATVCGAAASCVSLGASSSSCSATPVTTAVQSSACQTDAGIVCGPKATCTSLGPSSSTCQAVAITTTTASLSSACNTNSATVCASSNMCVSLGASTSTCGPTRAAATPSGVTMTAPVSSACNPAANTVCAPSAACSSVGPSTSTCGLVTTTQSSIGGACNTASATVCQSGVATCSAGQCALVTTTQSSIGGACNTASATVCQSGVATCSAGQCALVTTTQSSIGGACNTASATVCQSGVATCSAGTCARITSTAPVSSACNTASGTVCAAGTATCQSLGASTSTCAYITTTAAVSAACNTNAATVCAAGTATCQSLGASTSSCAYITTTAAVSAACNTGKATVCASGTATCQSLGASTSTCDYITTTAPVSSACNTNAATVCGAGIATCQSQGPSTSTCDYITTTASNGAACNTNAATICGNGANCNSVNAATSTCSATPTVASPTAGSTCTPNPNIAYCNTIQPTGTAGATGKTMSLYYGPANNGTYQTVPNTSVDEAAGSYKTACDAAQACANFAANNVSMGIVFYVSQCKWECGRFVTHNGPAFSNKNSAFSYSYGWST